MIGRRVAAVTLVLVVSCAPTIASTTTTVLPTTVTTGQSTTTVPSISTHLLESTTIDGALPIDIYGPDQPGPWPVVVLFHGGGWFGGDRISMVPLAES
ncbi:MAG TPA: hypothetical protein VFY46_02010, partial [Acidimicrobiia bacterium]|nr:hypothetical protein [Acidimicrobiia bacterium]